MHNIVIIDYSLNNLWSVEKSLEFLGYNFKSSNNHEDILKASHLILPGVGSFFKAMKIIKDKKLDLAINQAVLKRKTKILGICLGFQLLCAKGYEDGESKGLGLINAVVDKFDSNIVKVPHVGFNSIKINNMNSILYKGIKNFSDFYFVHSYKLSFPNENYRSENIATCLYEKEFIASIEKDNVFGTQFHPEKSQINGLKIIKNFLE